MVLNKLLLWYTFLSFVIMRSLKSHDIYYRITRVKLQWKASFIIINAHAVKVNVFVILKDLLRAALHLYTHEHYN